ncbi:hypothetical protein BKA82DRAFT_4517962 [Pisolithus tinctorius]|nr:hypothetical protein BKA82DRAFT_4517962 [Pisolithus tinctorius]
MGLLDWFRVSQTTIAPKDIVVFIVGPSGSGKSRLFSILVQITAKTHVPVDGGRWLGFTRVHAQRCRFEEESDIVLVDTPCLFRSEHLKEWLDSNYRKPCKAAGILYLHNIGSNPYLEFLKVSKHLGRLMPMYHQGLAPNTVHVVPTITLGAKLSTGRIDASMLLLKRQADKVGASMHRTPYDQRPETAWVIVQELLNGMKLGGSLVGGCVSEEMSSWGPAAVDFAVESNIALSRTLLEDAPLGHPDHYLALAELADALYQRFMGDDSREDLDEVIALRRASLELTPSGHQERLVALTNLADSLDTRFWTGGTMEDIVEAIPLRRAALQLTPPGHQEHRASLVHLAICLEVRFSNEGTMEDLIEIITLRRAALKLTPIEHDEYVMSLYRLADCLDLQYFTNGGTLSDLEEIISLQQAALACNYPSSTIEQAMCRASLTRCFGEKHLRQHVTPPVVDFAPPVYKRPIIYDPTSPQLPSPILDVAGRRFGRVNPLARACSLSDNVCRLSELAMTGLEIGSVCELRRYGTWHDESRIVVVPLLRGLRWVLGDCNQCAKEIPNGLSQSMPWNHH